MATSMEYPQTGTPEKYVFFLAIFNGVITGFLTQDSMEGLKIYVWFIFLSLYIIYIYILLEEEETSIPAGGSNRSPILSVDIEQVI